MLTLSPNLIEALSRDKVRPIWLVQVEASATRRYTFTSRVLEDAGVHAKASDVLAPEGAHPAIIEVATIGAEKDPFTGEYSMGSCEVRLADQLTPGPVRLMIYNNRLAGHAMYVWLGAEGVDQQDWAQVFVGIIKDHPPEPGVCAIHADDATGVLLSAKVEPSDWWAKHPLEIALDVLTRAKVPFATYDATSFDPQQYDDTATPISHWCVKDDTANPVRGQERNTNREDGVRNQYIGAVYGYATPRGAPGKWGEPIQAKAVLSELAEALGGSFLPDEDGKVRFKQYSATRDINRSLAAADVVDVVPVGVLHNLSNRITVSFGMEGDHDLQVQDDASAAAHVFTGETERFFDSDAKCAWANGDAELRLALGTGDTEMVVDMAGPQAFTGTRYDLSGWTPGTPIPAQDAWRLLSSTRVAYFMITALGAGSNVEIVKATAAIPFDSTGTAGPSTVALINGRRCFTRWTFTIQRGQLNTTGVAHAAGARVYDVTIPVAVAQRRLQRFAYGCPEAELRVPIRHLELQVGDFITFPDDLQSWYQTNGPDDTVWEIVRKEIATDGDKPGLTLKVLAAIDAFAIPGSSFDYSLTQGRATLGKQLAQLAYDKTFANPHVISGFTATSSAAFELELAEGVVASPVARWESNSPIKVPLKPSRDSYVYADPVARGLIILDVPNADPEPTTPGGTSPLRYVACDATGITASTDIRQLYALDGGKIASDTIPFSALPSSGTKGGMGALLVLRKAFTAGVAGSADDVTVFSSLPVGVRVVDSILLVTTAIGGSTATLRTATGGGGTALSDAFDTASTGRKRDTITAANSVGATGSIYLRRSDRGIAGTAILFLEKT